jgi:hypothetical protein
LLPATVFLGDGEVNRDVNVAATNRRLCKQWAAGAVSVTVAVALGGAQRYRCKAQCPNNLCNHDYSLDALNLSNEWVCKFDGCFCGKRRLSEPNIF